MTKPETKKYARPYGTALFGLVVDGISGSQVLGKVKSVSGGKISRDKLVYRGRNQNGHDALGVETALGRKKYEDISFDIGMAYLKQMWQWFTAPDQKKPEVSVLSNGEIKAADQALKVRAVRKFTGAFPTSLKLPQLEGKGSNSMMVSMKISPATITTEEPQNESFQPAEAIAGNFQQMYASSTFSVDFDQQTGFRDMQDKITQVSSISFTRDAHEYVGTKEGKAAIPMKVPGARTDPDSVTLQIPSVYDAPFRKHLETWGDEADAPKRFSFAVEVNKRSDSTKGAGGKGRTLLYLEFQDCVLTGVKGTDLDAGNASVAMSTLEIAIGRCELKFENPRNAPVEPLPKKEFRVESEPRPLPEGIGQ